MKVVFLVIASVLLINYCFAQERKIIGRIVDDETQKPIKNANIIIEGTTQTGVSNQLGFFELTVDDAKHKAIIVSHVGFVTSKINLPKDERFKFTLQKEYTRLTTLYLDQFPLDINAIEIQEPLRFTVNEEAFATPPKGIDWFYLYLGNSLSKKLIELNSNISLNFTIDETGKAVNVSAANSSEFIVTSIRAVFDSMELWTPAQQRNAKVPQQFTMFITPKGSLAGAIRNLNNFLSLSVAYPEAARSKGIDGTVDLEFKVNDDGTISITTLHDLDGDCGDEVRKNLKAVPRVYINDLVSAAGTNRFLQTVTFSFETAEGLNPFTTNSNAFRLPNVSIVARGIDSPQATTNKVGLSPAGFTPSKLKGLSLTNRGFADFPVELLELTFMEFLDLERNKIRTLPEDIYKLKNLTELYLIENQLESVPKKFAQLQKLRVLSLGFNRFQTFPTELFALRKLETLDLSGNTISEIPAQISSMSSLTTLVIHSNRLTTIPSAIFSLRNLKKLVIEGNPIPQAEVEKFKSQLKKVEVVF
jgi:hypothetical protein